MFTENFKIVPIAAPIDLNATSPVACESINVSKYHKVTYVFLFGTLAGNSSVLTICSGATDAAATTGVYFNYAFGSAEQGTANWDVLAAWTNAAALTITHTSYDNFMLVCEVDPAVMTSTHKWLTPIFTDPGGATGLVNAVAILRPRFGSNVAVTALS